MITWYNNVRSDGRSIHNLFICAKISISPVGDNYGISGGNVIGMIAYLLFYGRSESFTILDTWYKILEAYPSLQGMISVQIYRLNPLQSMSGLPIVIPPHPTEGFIPSSFKTTDSDEGDYSHLARGVGKGAPSP